MLARLLVVSRCLAARGALVRRVGAGALLQRPPRPFSATRLFSTTGREASALVAGDFADSDYLRLSDEDLLKQCRVDTRRDSGPGGQHRNKVESAVRITHLPTGVISNAAEDRSQIRNKGVAIKRLRKTIACEVRRPEAWLEPINAQTVSAATLPPELAGILPTTKLAKKIGKSNDLRPVGEQMLLDVLAAARGSVGDAARYLGASTNQVTKVLASEDELFAAANRIRAGYDLKPLSNNR
mmetsp:Transcript_2052/g.7497  ORF Transcript_2052/g.7497 Transcript_2052/m.7497 type:complete len:240 (+) Transcript_2052:117-836(+)